MASRTLLWMALFVFLACMGLRLQTLLAPERTQRNRERGTLDYFENLIHDRYVDEVTDEKLFYGAMQGMAGSLDRHSVFWTPDEYKIEQSSNDGQFGGVGLEISTDDTGLTVLTPIKDSPAYKAGIWPDDRIVKIDGTDARKLPIEDASRLLRGKEGTPVVLTVERPGHTEPMEITLNRNIIRIYSVQEPRLLTTADGLGARVSATAPKIGYARINQFQKETAIELEAALQRMEGSGIEALILDLREDPGGLLTSAVEVCDLFMREGKIVSIKERNNPKRPAQDEVFEAKAAGTHKDYPVAVLINGHSASASEIVAGCMKDHKRGVLVGEKSYGKGSVQSILPVDLGEKGEAAVKLTTAKYFTPSGICIDGLGIQPDYEVVFTADQYKRFLIDKRKRKLQDSDPRRDPALNPNAEKFIDEQRRKAQADEAAGAKPFYDTQLEKAVSVLTEQLEKQKNP